MDVIIGTDVDVISPFPATMLPQAAGWMRCYKTMVFGDDGPQTNEDIEIFLRNILSMSNISSWAIVDKANLTKTKHEAPLVGILYFERANTQNGYIHVASHRRAWGDKLAQPGLIEQGARLVLDHLFETEPNLARISVAVLASNKAARNFAQRVGFRKDGYFINMAKVGGKPENVVHLGMLREVPQAALVEGV